MRAETAKVGVGGRCAVRRTRPLSSLLLFFSSLIVWLFVNDEAQANDFG